MLHTVKHRTSNIAKVAKCNNILINCFVHTCVIILEQPGIIKEKQYSSIKSLYETCLLVS